VSPELNLYDEEWPIWTRTEEATVPGAESPSRTRTSARPAIANYTSMISGRLHHLRRAPKSTPNHWLSTRTSWSDEGIGSFSPISYPVPRVEIGRSLLWG